MKEIKFLNYTINLNKNEYGFFEAIPDDCDATIQFSKSLEELLNSLYEMKYC